MVAIKTENNQTVRLLTKIRFLTSIPIHGTFIFSIFIPCSQFSFFRSTRGRSLWTECLSRRSSERFYGYTMSVRRFPGLRRCLVFTTLSVLAASCGHPRAGYLNEPSLFPATLIRTFFLKIYGLVGLTKTKKQRFFSSVCLSDVARIPLRACLRWLDKSIKKIALIRVLAHIICILLLLHRPWRRDYLNFIR